MSYYRAVRYSPSLYTLAVTMKQKIFFHESKLQCFQDCITVQDNLLARVLCSKFDSEKQLVDFILAIQATLSSSRVSFP